MSPFDFFIVGGYLVGCMALGLWLASSAKGVNDYFLGEKDIPAWAVMISIVATETSAVTFLSVPGKAYQGDWTFLQLALGYIFARIVVAIVLMPGFFRGEIRSAYEVLARRFGRGTRTAASILFLVSRTLGSGLRLFLAASVLQTIAGWNLSDSIIVIGVSTIVYTSIGGLKGVVWTDVLQLIIYLTAAATAVHVLQRTIPGGWPEIFRVARIMGKLRTFDFSTDWTVAQTFWAGAIGALVMDMGTHGADHMMVQRYLAARSQKQASVALVASGFFVFAQFALFLSIGTGIYVKDYLRPPLAPLPGDRVFAQFMVKSFPEGLLGLVVAAILSVTMSTVSGALSASASSTTDDLYRPLFPKTSEKTLFGLSRGLIVFWGIAQMLVAWGAIGLTQSVVDSALSIASYVMGILLGLFLLGLWTRDVDDRAALIGTLFGLIVVSAVAFGTKLAYPWYAVVGSTTVVLAGMMASRLRPRAS